MKVRACALALVVASACGTGSETTVAPADTSAPSSTAVTTTAAPTTGPDIDVLIDRVAVEFFDIDRARGIDFVNKDEYRCAVRRVVDELGINVVSDVYSRVADAADIEEFSFVFADATADCVDQEKFAYRVAKWNAEGMTILGRNGAEGLTPREISSCHARRFVDEVGPKVFEDVLAGAEDAVPFDELSDKLGAAVLSCVHLDRFSTTTTTNPSDPPEEDWEEIEEDIRSQMVEILIERGMTPEEAEFEADQNMAEGTDPKTVEDQIAIWEDWMNNYERHWVLGSYWTADEAECVMIAMMRERGIYETDRQIKGATTGGMDEEDAEFLVRPVADCVDLKAMLLADTVLHGYQEDPECLLADVTEEQVASWYVALFTDGPDGSAELAQQDVNQSC